MFFVTVTQNYELSISPNFLAILSFTFLVTDLLVDWCAGGGAGGLGVLEALPHGLGGALLGSELPGHNLALLPGQKIK